MTKKENLKKKRAKISSKSTARVSFQSYSSQKINNQNNSDSRYCLALDLKDDQKLIQEYEKYHENVWPEILEYIKGADITKMDIYRVHNRLFMIMETGSTFSFEKLKTLSKESEINKKWEDLMWKFQQKLPHAEPGEKWILMNKIFSLDSSGQEQRSKDKAKPQRARKANLKQT